MCRACTSFAVALAVKILTDLLKGLWSYGGFNFRGTGFPKFSAAPVDKTMCRTPKRFRAVRTCPRSSIVGLDTHIPWTGASYRRSTYTANSAAFRTSSIRRSCCKCTAHRDKFRDPVDLPSSLAPPGVTGLGSLVWWPTYTWNEKTSIANQA